MPALKRALPWLVLLLVAGLLAWKLHTMHFDWPGFAHSLRSANPWLILLGVLAIYSNNFIRALRWRIFLRPAYKQSSLEPIPWWKLVGSQFVGFTGLAIFGRIGELIRPLLVSRRTGLPFSSQVALVAVERVFDLGAFGIIFALDLLLSPALRTLPYLHKAGYTIGALTLAITLFVLGVRLAGERIAALAGRLAGLASKAAGEAVGEKILAFRHGLDVIDTFTDFALSAFLSIVLWLTIACAYVFVLKAFPAPVHDLTPAHIVVLMGFSVAGSALPVPGGSGAWAGNVFALTQLFHIPGELAGSAGLLVWLVTTMAVVPAGLLYAKLEGISLGQVIRRSEDETAATP